MISKFEFNENTNYWNKDKVYTTESAIYLERIINIFLIVLIFFNEQF